MGELNPSSLVLIILGATFATCTFVAALNFFWLRKQYRSPQLKHVGAQRRRASSFVVRQKSARVVPLKSERSYRVGLTSATANRSRKWLSSFVKIDSRTQLANFFFPGDASGPSGALSFHSEMGASRFVMLSVASRAILDRQKLLSRLAEQRTFPSARIVDEHGEASSSSVARRERKQLDRERKARQQSSAQSSGSTPIARWGSSRGVRGGGGQIGMECFHFGCAEHLRMFPSAFFSVWRPTSADALRLLVLREGVGKGYESLCTLLHPPAPSCTLLLMSRI